MGRRRRSMRQDRDGLSPLPNLTRLEIGSDGYEYEVRPVTGAAAAKGYRCPGCDHEIRSGTPHVVVWQAGMGDAGIDERRHWHTACWASRNTRRPTRKRG
jgi:hypothetical protein